MIDTKYAAADGSVQAENRDRFFLGMSGLLLLILLVGFSRTLYLRLFFEVPAIPGYLHVHGATVTAWFVLLVVQASLVNVRRVDIHRRLGILGAVLGVAVIPAGLMATLQFIPRLPEIGLPFEVAPRVVTWIVFANFHMLLGFVVFLAAASALIVSSALGVLTGAAVSNWISPEVVRWVAGLGFIAVGIWVLRRSRRRS